MALRQAGLSGPGGQGYAPLTNAINRQWRAGVRALWSSVLGLVTQSLAVQLIFGLAIWLAVWLALSGQCDPVWAVVLIGLAAQFSGPLKILSELETAFKRARIELQEVSQLLALPGLAEPAAPEALSGRVDVAFEQVSFRYPSTPPPTGAGGAAWLFDRLDLHIPQGSLTALVGPSGCGKTTLTRLMARFCEPQQGRITLGGVDIRQLRYQDLMSALSLVFQDVCLFDDTLEANIRIGNPAASQQQLLEVAALARVTDIVARLPGGWQSPVGEGGRLLSGGERQRVSVARALLKGAPLLLLDEATAAQDPLTAMAITQAISALKGQVTIIVIAHQLATIRSADRIVFLDNGRVCEQGTHAALIARNGRYAHFWHSRGRYHHPFRKNGDMTCG
nr:ABC transporter ATP-binding protein [Shimwellia pseudoproteus]